MTHVALISQWCTMMKCQKPKQLSKKKNPIASPTSNNAAYTLSTDQRVLQNWTPYFHKS